MLCIVYKMDEIENNYKQLKILEQEFVEKIKNFNEMKAVREENKRLKEEIKDYKELQKLIQKLGKA